MSKVFAPCQRQGPKAIAIPCIFSENNLANKSISDISSFYVPQEET